MNPIARLAFIVALVLFLPDMAMAQLDELKRSTPQQRASLQTEWMKTNLSLDEKASATVAEINFKYAQENQALMDSASPKLARLMSFRRNLQAKDVEMKAVLTPEQYSLYEQKKDELEAKMKQKFMEKRGAAQ